MNVRPRNANATNTKNANDKGLDIKQLVALKKAVPLGVRQEHLAKPKAGAAPTPGFTVRFLVTRLETLKAPQTHKGQKKKDGKDAKGAKAKGDLAKLQGIWTGVVAELGGRPMPNLKEPLKMTPSPCAGRRLAQSFRLARQWTRSTRCSSTKPKRPALST